MNATIRLETNSRFYSISLGVLLATGWLVVLGGRIMDVPFFWKGAQHATVKDSRDENRAFPLVRQELEAGRLRMVVAADRILLTDKNRPRVSQALSEPINPQLSAFTAQQKRWRVLLEHGPGVPDSHLTVVERYYRNYKRYTPVRSLRADFGARMELVVEVIP